MRSWRFPVLGCGFAGAGGGHRAAGAPGRSADEDWIASLGLHASATGLPQSSSGAGRHGRFFVETDGWLRSPRTFLHLAALGSGHAEAATTTVGAGHATLL